MIFFCICVSACIPILTITRELKLLESSFECQNVCISKNCLNFGFYSSRATSKNSKNCERSYRTVVNEFKNLAHTNKDINKLPLSVKFQLSNLKCLPKITESVSSLEKVFTFFSNFIITYIS